MRLPHLTEARSKALAELGINTEQSMADWSAAQLAAAVNEINERTRTPASAAASWLTAAFHQPPPVEPELDELDGWETVGDFSVWFQRRTTGDGDGVEQRIRVISHHDPTENHTEVWPGHDLGSTASWMRRHLSGAGSSAVAESDPVDPVDPVDVVDGRGLSGPMPGTVTTGAAPRVARVLAASPDRLIDLLPADGRRPVLPSRRWQLEVRLDDAFADSVSAELLLESSCGDRLVVDATGDVARDAGVLASAPVECAPGYHEARLHVRNSSTGRLLRVLTMPAILVEPPADG